MEGTDFGIGRARRTCLRWRHSLPRTPAMTHPSDIAPADAAAATAAIADVAAAPTAAVPSRLEHDLLGDREVPADAYYGVHTLRAVENFPITGTVDRDLPGPHRRAGLHQGGRGARQPRTRAARRRARRRDRRGLPRDLRGGKLHEQFVVDVIQGGAGTSTNMNANEVIANRALELLGHAKGEYQPPAPERPRQPGPEHQRRLSDGAEDRRPLRHRAADRRDGRAAPRLRAQGGRVRRRAEDGPHPAAGRRADDARPGVRDLRA